MRRLALIVMTACAAEEVRDKPVAPDMSELIASYATPTANFDLQGATELQPFVEDKVSALIDFDAIVDRIQEAIEALNDDGASLLPTRSIVLEGEGTARVQRICTGFGDPEPPIDKDANGFLELTVGYSNDGLDPVVFGGATACQEQVGGVRMEVAGDVNLFVGVGTGITELAATTFLFQLANFSFLVNDVERISGGFDFEVCRGEQTACVPGHVGMLFTLGSGSTLIFFVDLTTKTGGFRAADGVWTCNFPTGECTSDQGGMVTIPAYQL
jgi:hypothetical protein